MDGCLDTQVREVTETGGDTSNEVREQRLLESIREDSTSRRGHLVGL